MLILTDVACEGEGSLQTESECGGSVLHVARRVTEAVLGITRGDGHLLLFLYCHVPGTI